MTGEPTGRGVATSSEHKGEAFAEKKFRSLSYDRLRGIFQTGSKIWRMADWG